jgi:predicted RNA-binding Zn-ribbon protein involved in translation (DUF1610 family)
MAALCSPDGAVRRIGKTEMDARDVRECDECRSDYFAGSSQMAALCPECAHLLYGYPPCAHSFDHGRCTACGWDGSRSDYLRHRSD